MTFKIDVPNDSWINVTSAAGYAAYNITNPSSSVILIAQGSSAPVSDYDAEQLTTLDGFYAKARITGTDPLWAKAVGFDGYAVVTEV